MHFVHSQMPLWCDKWAKRIIPQRSAGAYTASLIATDPRYLRRIGAYVDLHSLVGLAGPYDLRLGHPSVKEKCDRVRDGQEPNPVALARVETPPVLPLGRVEDISCKSYAVRR